MMALMSEFPVRIDGMDGTGKVYQLADKLCPECFQPLYELDIETPAGHTRVHVCPSCWHEEVLEKVWRY